VKRQAAKASAAIFAVWQRRKDLNRRHTDYDFAHAVIAKEIAAQPIPFRFHWLIGISTVAAGLHRRSQAKRCAAVTDLDQNRSNRTHL
jgi:hypothetical protein